MFELGVLLATTTVASIIGFVIDAQGTSAFLFGSGTADIWFSANAHISLTDNDIKLRDLSAQESMALSSGVAVGVACVSLIISGLALFYLRQSLKQTNKSIDKNEELAKAQLRAYPSMVLVGSTFGSESEINLSLSIANKSSSDARMGKISVVLRPLSRMIEAREEVEDIKELARGTRSIGDLYPQDDYDVSIGLRNKKISPWLDQVFNETYKGFLLSMRLDYADVFGDPQQRTIFHYCYLNDLNKESVLTGEKVRWKPLVLT